MTLDPHFDASDGEWIDCPVCTDDGPCPICHGARGFESAALAELHDPDNLKSINGEFA